MTGFWSSCPDDLCGRVERGFSLDFTSLGWVAPEQASIPPSGVPRNRWVWAASASDYGVFVADRTKKGHRTWLETPGRRGQKHRDTPMRNFLDPEDEFLERWELLGLG